MPSSSLPMEAVSLGKTPHLELVEVEEEQAVETNGELEHLVRETVEFVEWSMRNNRNTRCTCDI